MSLYKEYSKILLDEKFGSRQVSPTYRRKKDDLTIEYTVNKKGKHVIYSYNECKTFQEKIKSWYNNGDLYKSFCIVKRYDETIKSYYKNGVLHRDNKPANIINIYKYRAIITDEYWYQNGMLHNLEGPAHILIEDEMHDIHNPSYYSEEDYYIYDVKFNKHNYNEHISKIKREQLSHTLYNMNITCKDICSHISKYVY